MAFSFGFYNSLAGDRRYDSVQVSRMINALIIDGIIPSQGNMYATRPGEGLELLLDSGLAWFNSTWNYNDATMSFELPPPDIMHPQYHALILEINSEVAVRTNSLKLISGVIAAQPVRPELIMTDTIKQYALSYTLVPPMATQITPSMIDIVVGRVPTPFATGVLETVSIDVLFAKWADEFYSWMAQEKFKLADWLDQLQEVLDENAAANLFNLIHNHTNDKNNPHEVTAEQIIDLEPSGAGEVNKFVNPLIDVWQEALSQNNPNGYGAATMYRVHMTGGATGTVSRQDVTVFSDWPGATFFHRTVINTLGTVTFSQRFENVLAHYGKEAFVFQFKSDQDRDIAVELRQHFGTGGSADVVGIGRQIIPVKAEVDRYLVPFDIPFADGKIIGANGYLELIVTYSNPELGIAQTGTFDIGILGFGKFSLDTPIRQDRSSDLHRIEWVYERFFQGGTLDWLPVVWRGGSVNWQGYFKHAKKRIWPITTFSPASSNNYALISGGGAVNATGAGFVGRHTGEGSMSFTAGTGAASQSRIVILGPATFIALDSRL